MKTIKCDRLGYDNIAQFINDKQSDIFRYWIYRKIYTPFEQDKKYMDESIYEDDTCRCAYIRECIKLPDGDVLLGFEDAECFNDKDLKRDIQYCKLSEIRLEWYEGDQEEFEDEYYEDEDEE